MDDNQKNAVWDDLLEDLGAKPDQTAYERHQPETQEIPPAVEPSASRDTQGDTQGEPQQSSSDWNALAETLGIEVEEPSPAEPVGQASAAPVEASPVDEGRTAADQCSVEADDAEELADVAEVAAGQPFGGSLASPDDEIAANDFSDDDFTEIDEADDDEAGREEVGEVQAAQSDELPPLPSQIDQALNDSGWQDDQSADVPAAADAESSATSDEPDGGGITGEAARSAFDALFADSATGWGSAFLERPKQVDEQGSLVHDIGGKPSLPRESEKDDFGDKIEGDEDSEKPKRKRSRRRRRGGKGRKPAGEQAASGETTDENATERTGAGPTSAGEKGAGETGAGETDGDEGGLGDENPTAAPKRPRRSRARRGSRPAEVEDNRFRDDLDDDDDDGDDLDENLKGDDGDGDLGDESPLGTARGRKRHSNLPTWSDAIGMIVDGNLESRAKSPSKPQSSRSRGGRGGGGRRRSSKKPESK